MPVTTTEQKLTLRSSAWDTYYYFDRCWYRIFGPDTRFAGQCDIQHVLGFRVAELHAIIELVELICRLVEECFGIEPIRWDQCGMLVKSPSSLSTLFVQVEHHVLPF